ncbi:hypothetical protein CERZMDRAFT_96732 [Cercospora zeae-maydis SCOH1-5]|uniref:Uncharacterized protein n=1 Tax=Cercospora zeae-maydis SCOH1-5 TaxID=717836 RepID=A0A6A6FI70_9PEZI|nr:hypothetical protein CERZMDRAFT_96732 [Cercospora zeae-maydis SCOH1-5]
MSGAVGFAGATPVGKKRGREDGELEDGRRVKRARTTEEDERRDREMELFGEVSEGEEEDGELEDGRGAKRARTTEEDERRDREMELFGEVSEGEEENGELEDGHRTKRARTTEEDERRDREMELFGEDSEGDEEDEDEEDDALGRALAEALRAAREDSLFEGEFLEEEEEEDPLFSWGFSTEELANLSAADLFGEDVPMPAKDHAVKLALPTQASQDQARKGAWSLALPTQASQDQAKKGAWNLALPMGTLQKQKSGENEVPFSVDAAAITASTIQTESDDRETSVRISIPVEGSPPSTDEDVVVVSATRRKSNDNRKKPVARPIDAISPSTIKTSALFVGRKKRAWEQDPHQQGSSNRYACATTPCEVPTTSTSLHPGTGEISAPIDLTASTKRERKALLKQQHEERKAIREREIAEKYAVSLDVPPRSQEEVNGKYSHIETLRMEAGHEAVAYNDPEGHQAEKRKKKAAKMAEWRSRKST